MLKFYFNDISINRYKVLLILELYFVWSLLFISLERDLSVLMISNIIFPFWTLLTFMLIEDKYNINLSFCSLPIKRTTIVLSKYTSYFCVLLVTTMLTILASLLLKTMFGEVLNYIDITKVMSIQYISIVIIFSSLISSMTIPFYFKSGYPKGLFMGIFLFLMVMGVCIGFVYIIVSLKTGNWGIERYSNIENQNSLSFIIGLIGYAVDVFPEKNIFIYMMLITISCTLASFKLAIKFFKNREL